MIAGEGEGGECSRNRVALMRCNKVGGQGCEPGQTDIGLLFDAVFLSSSFPGIPKRDSFKNQRQKTSLSKVSEDDAPRKDSLWDAKKGNGEDEEDVEIKPGCCLRFFSLCCGCHAQQKWYSLRGKGGLNLEVEVS